MKYYILEPEVAGGFDDNCVIDRSVFPPKIIHLHYRFDGWCGDEIIECFPCYLVTQPLKERIQRAKLTGAEFATAEISFGGQFCDLYGDKPMPAFVWLNVTGSLGKEDFALLPDARLLVSERALDVILESHPLVLTYSAVGNQDDG